jgi:hypothetical protein
MTTEYKDGDFATPAAVCDVIMKGGITSGVVYPLALTELAKQFRLSQVGGTSAGAIAAAAAAAAEYGRHVPAEVLSCWPSCPTRWAKSSSACFSRFLH